ncbi:MAG TPA: glycosyltransferase family 39 protein [Candidatus Hydrogenedentes bacterium]|nr:glycosyltransferase family 39 protein [Candidatus Hydrogenedentota bacterium]HPJ99961.1 glycosyltransferase family 39 protein [Candidatus Hydrogenedentota bacterium]
MVSLIHKHFWLVLLFAALFAAFFELGRMDVYTDNEGQRATPPAEMLRTGDYLVPTINGTTYLAKPPLLYWAIAAVYRMTGRISALTARIPTAACAVGMVLAVYLVFRKRLGELAARFAALALLASPYFLERSRWAELDVPLTLATFLALAACWRAFEEDSLAGQTRFTLLGGLAMGAAIMLKGPVPALFLGAAWAAYLLTHGETRGREFAGLAVVIVAALTLEYLLKFTGILAFPLALMSTIVCGAIWAWKAAPQLRLKVSIISGTVFLVGALLALPWALAVLYDQGWDNIRSLLHSEVITRTHSATEINSGSPVYYLVALPLLLAPWSFLIPLHFSRTERHEGGINYRFCTAAAWISILLFSLIAGKEYEYILPAFPFLMGATGVTLERFYRGSLTGWVKRWAALWARAAVIILALFAIAMMIYAVSTDHPAIFVVEAVGLSALAAAAGVWGLRRRTFRLHCVVFQALAVLVVGLLASRSFFYTGANSPREIAETTGRLLQSGYRVEAGWFRHPWTPAFAFYAATPVPMQMNFDFVKQRLAETTPYFLLIRKKDLENGPIMLDPSTYRVLMGPYTSKEYLLIGNTGLPPSVAPPEPANLSTNSLR